MYSSAYVVESISSILHIYVLPVYEIPDNPLQSRCLFRRLKIKASFHCVSIQVARFTGVLHNRNLSACQPCALAHIRFAWLVSCGYYDKNLRRLNHRPFEHMLLQLGQKLFLRCIISRTSELLINLLQPTLLLQTFIIRVPY